MPVGTPISRFVAIHLDPQGEERGFARLEP
jgi:hypothetical protein